MHAFGITQKRVASKSLIHNFLPAPGRRSKSRVSLTDQEVVKEERMARVDSQEERTICRGKVSYFQWIVQDVKFTLSQYEMRDFELSIESDWKAAEKYEKNTNVEDF